MICFLFDSSRLKPDVRLMVSLEAAVSAIRPPTSKACFEALVHVESRTLLLNSICAYGRLR